MNLISRIAKNTIYQIIGKSAGVILGLITVGLMTRYLGQTGYGYWTAIIAFLQFFGALTDFGLQMATTHLLSKPDADEQKIFANILALRFCSSIFFLGLAAGLVWVLPYPLIVKQGISLASLAFLFTALQSVFISIFYKKMAMAKVAIAEVWGRLILLLGVWILISEGKNLLWLIGAVILGGLTNLLILYLGARQYFKIRFAFNWRLWQKIFQTSWPLALTVVLTLVYFRADTIIMSFSRPPNEVGLYGATYKVLEVLIQMPYLFLGLILPLLTKFFTLNKALFQTTLQKAFDFLIIITIPMVLAAMVLGQKIMVLVAGNDFLISGQLLQVLIIAVGLIFIGALFGYGIVAAELQKKMIKFYLIDAVISVPLYLIFIPIYSYWAAAILTIMTEAIITFSAYYVIKKYAGVRFEFKIIKKALIASLIMALVLYLLINQGLITLIIIGLLVYFWILYMIKGVRKSDVLEIVKFKNQE